MPPRPTSAPSRSPFIPLAVAAVVASGLSASASAATPVDVLAGVEPRVNVTKGNRGRRVAVRGQDFKRAVRLESSGEGDAWHAQMLIDTAGDVAEGDVFAVKLWLNSVAASGSADGRGRATVHFHNGDRTKAGLLVRESLSVEKGWREYIVPFKSRVDAKAGEAGLMLNFNSVQQTLLVGPVSILNYGPDYALEELSRGLASYQGQEPDAAWRAAAAARIEKYRTGPLTVRVVDAAGDPVAGVEVDVAMTRHAFPFGSSVAIELLTLRENEFPWWSRRGTRQWADAKRYREIVTSHFTRITPEGALRPHGYAMHRDPARSRHPGIHEKKAKAFDRLADFAAEHRLDVRGHTLSWGATEHGPWKQISGSRDEHHAAMVEILDEIPAAVGHFVTEWDTLNHPCGWGKSIEDLYGGLDMHVEIMRRARASAPPETLHYVNEGHVLTERSRVPDYERIIKYLIDHGQGPDGIGMMAHFNRAQLTGMDDAWDVLERFAKLAPRLQLTELDVSTAGDDALHADYLRDIMTLCFSHPQMAGIVMWGFWEGNHWKPETALWREDWTIKPAGEAWLKLVKEDWWTDVTVTTDADGRAVVPHAFYGEYAVTAAGAAAETGVTHRDGPTRLTVALAR